jgi:polyisoprenoid-binding protein YceI
MANTVKWVVDPMHSELQFKVKHLVISTVTGSFKVFSGEVLSPETDFAGAAVSFSADVNSINTDNEQRDGHLKSPEFFDAASFPAIDFKGKSLTKKGDSEYTLEGDLTIKGNTHPVTLAVEFGGSTVDFYGQTKAGFEVTGKINRKDFGLVWDGITETGSVVVSDEVKIIGNIQFTKQA